MSAAYINKDDDRQLVINEKDPYQRFGLRLKVMAVASEKFDGRFRWISMATGRSGRTGFDTKLQCLKAAAKSLKFKLVLEEDQS